MAELGSGDPSHAARFVFQMDALVIRAKTLRAFTAQDGVAEP